MMVGVLEPGVGWTQAFSGSLLCFCSGSTSGSALVLLCFSGFFVSPVFPSCSRFWRRGRSWVRWLFLGFLLPVFSFSFSVQFPSFSSPFRSWLYFFLFRSLIFFGFIARECQAPLQLKQLQNHYCRNRSCGRRRKGRWMISKNGVVCAMGMTIFNLVTKVLKSCNQALG